MRPPDPAKRELRRNSSEPVNSSDFTGNRQQVCSQGLGLGSGGTRWPTSRGDRDHGSNCGLVQAYGVTPQAKPARVSPSGPKADIAATSRSVEFLLPRYTLACSGLRSTTWRMLDGSFTPSATAAGAPDHVRFTAENGQIREHRGRFALGVTSKHLTESPHWVRLASRRKTPGPRNG
jgi:hypothetical protein